MATVYKVTETIGDKSQVRLIEAKNAAQAIRHVTKKSITCEVVSVSDAHALAKKGVEVEQAAADPA